MNKYKNLQLIITAERLKTQGFLKGAPVFLGSFFVPPQAIVPQQLNPIPI